MNVDREAKKKSDSQERKQKKRVLEVGRGAAESTLRESSAAS